MQNLWINFERTIEQSSGDRQLEKRETGFSLAWYFEDGDGKRVDVEQDEKYLSDTKNMKFIRFMNILFQSVTTHNASVEDMWDNVEDSRLEYLLRKLNNDLSLQATCTH